MLRHEDRFTLGCASLFVLIIMAVAVISSLP